MAVISGKIGAAVDFYADALAKPGRLLTSLTSQWSIRFIGGDGDDVFSASDNNDFLKSSGGNDLFGGNFGFDRAVYTDAPGRIDVQLADGTVTKYAGATGPELRAPTRCGRSNSSPEPISTTRSMRPASTRTGQNGGSTVTSNINGTSNEFEGRGGNDIITGNGATRVSYLHATAGVMVDLNAPTPGCLARLELRTARRRATWRASERIRSSAGSMAFAVRISTTSCTAATTRQPGTFQSFEGRGGDDYIDGRGGFDRAVYANEDAGIDCSAGNRYRHWWSEYGYRYAAFDRGHHRDRIQRRVRRERLYRQQ